MVEIVVEKLDDESLAVAIRLKYDANFLTLGGSTSRRVPRFIVDLFAKIVSKLKVEKTLLLYQIK